MVRLILVHTGQVIDSTSGQKGWFEIEDTWKIYEHNKIFNKFAWRNIFFQKI